MIQYMIHIEYAAFIGKTAHKQLIRYF